MPTNPDLAALSATATQELIDLDTLPEQVQSLRNHAAERRSKGSLKSADNLEASAYLIETLAAECARHRTGNLVQIDREGMRERVARGMVKAIGLDFEEPCGYETDADECDSGTCIAAHHEDHDADYC